MQWPQQRYAQLDGVRRHPESVTWGEGDYGVDQARTKLVSLLYDLLALMRTGSLFLVVSWPCL